MHVCWHYNGIVGYFSIKQPRPHSISEINLLAFRALYDVNYVTVTNYLFSSIHFLPLATVHTLKLFESNMLIECIQHMHTHCQRLQQAKYRPYIVKQHFGLSLSWPLIMVQMNFLYCIYAQFWAQISGETIQLRANCFKLKRQPYRPSYTVEC